MTRTMKVFRQEESERTGLGECAIAMRLLRGKYKIRLRRKNAREVYVYGNPVYFGRKHVRKKA